MRPILINLSPTIFISLTGIAGIGLLIIPASHETGDDQILVLFKKGNEIEIKTCIVISEQADCSALAEW